MNCFAVLKTFFKPCAALTAAAGALVLASCYAPAPPQPGPPFGPSKFGYRGTEATNYPPPNNPQVKPGDPGPKIIRNTTENVDISPPDPRIPANNPTVTNPPANVNPLPPTNPEPPKPPPAVKEDLPYGIPVVGKKGMVYSPFAPEKGQVDVDGYKRGTRVECPYTGKHFRVP